MEAATILIPHDGSPLSAAVVDALAPLLGPSTQVTVLHVDEGLEHADDAIVKTVQWLESKRATVVRREVKNDDAAEAILDTIFLLKPDLVAMSTHGRSGIERWVRGSVAERVLRECPVPLLMANPTANPETAFRRILVPLDRSATSAHVLETLLPLARTSSATVTLLYVDWDDPTDTPELAQRRRALRRDELTDAFAPVVARVEGAGLAVRLGIVHGDAADRILDMAASGNHDLLAITTHGRRGPSRWLFGSVTEKVLRECRLPMFVVRTPRSP